MGGKCGIVSQNSIIICFIFCRLPNLQCGDPFDANPKQHEAPNGKFANGVIVREYQPGQVMKVQIQVTANHKGHFTFMICPNNNVNQDPTQDCFDK